MISFLKNTETKYDVYWDNFTIGQIVLDSSDKFWYFFPSLDGYGAHSLSAIASFIIGLEHKAS